MPNVTTKEQWEESIEGVVDIPISIHNFFRNATVCYQATITASDKSGGFTTSDEGISVTIQLDDYGENSSVYTAEVIKETSEGVLYHSHYHTYFLVVTEQGEAKILVRSV